MNRLVGIVAVVVLAGALAAGFYFRSPAPEPVVEIPAVVEEALEEAPVVIPEVVVPEVND